MTKPSPLQNLYKFCRKYRGRLLLILILLVGFSVRLINIDKTPLGINADEAYAGYEAWSMANDGTDSHGYANPVYFVSWGSGMNVLYSYLSMPAVKIFGLNVFSIRITQAIFGCLTLVLIYLIARKFLDRRKSLILLGILAICPWHVMLSRWGLESDILPFCMTLGVFGFVYGLKKKPFLLLSALGFGLCLYSYAVAWIVVPFFIALLVYYGIHTRQLTLNRWSIFSGVLLLLFALPLLLLILVNIGVIPEIRSSFLSVPKLPYFGSGGYNLEIFEHIAVFINIIFNFSTDGYNAIHGIGHFFLFTSPFLAYGIWHVVRQAINDKKARKWSLEILCAIWFIAYIPVILFIDGANSTRINAIFIPLLLSLVLGVLHLARTGFGRRVLPIFLIAYAIAFVGFWQIYPSNRTYNFHESVEPISLTNGTGENVYFDQINFAEILVATKPTISGKTAIQDNPDITKGRFTVVHSIGRYKLTTPVEDLLDDTGTYIIRSDNQVFNERLKQAGFLLIYENADRKVWRHA